MVKTVEKSFAREISQLDDVHAFAEDFIKERLLPERAANLLLLTLEELFTNAVKYSLKNPAAITIVLLDSEFEYQIEIRDPNPVKFDPLQEAPVDVTRPLETRTPGGLGLHLLKTMTDKMEYEYKAKTNCIKITIKKDSKNA